MTDILRGVTDKALRSELRAAVQRGWQASITGNGHVKLLPPNGQRPLFAPLTPGSNRTMRNMRAAIRRIEAGS
jgi:hypothetical protein